MGGIGRGFFCRVWGGNHASLNLPCSSPGDALEGDGPEEGEAEDEPERLDLSPNPFTRIPVFSSECGRKSLFPSFFPLNLNEFIPLFPFFLLFPSFLSADWFLEVTGSPSPERSIRKLQK